MKYNLKIKFPCGFEYSENLSTSSMWIDEGELTSFDDIKECPLHGKKCKCQK